MSRRPLACFAPLAMLLLVAVPLAAESVRLPDGSVLRVDEALREGDLLRVRLGEIAFYVSPDQVAILDAPSAPEPASGGPSAPAPPTDSEVRPMIEALQATDPGARRLAVAALASRVEAEARDAILGAVVDSAPEVRAEAIRTLRDDENAFPIERLLEVLQRENETAPRLAAIDALGARGGDLAVEWLGSLKDDPEVPVRQAARAALRRLQGR